MKQGIDGYTRICNSTSGGYIDLHPAHGNNELNDNIKACKILADLGYQIELLPIIPASEDKLITLLLSDLFQYKNPDTRINGKLIGDIKTPTKDGLVKKSAINNAIYSAAKQKVEIVIINLTGCDYTIQNIKKGIVGAMQPNRNKSIKRFGLLQATKMFSA